MKSLNAATNVIMRRHSFGLVFAISTIFVHVAAEISSSSFNKSCPKSLKKLSSSSSMLQQTQTQTQSSQSFTTEMTPMQSTQNDIPTQTQTISQTTLLLKTTEIPTKPTTTDEAQTPSTFFEAITEFEYEYTYSPQKYRKSSLDITDILPEDPKSYDKMRPPKKDGQATTVFFHVTVMGLDSIDETSMTYAADIFFAQTWKDHRLRLPENMTSEYRLLEVDWLKNMWRPDSFFKNAKSVTFQTMTIPNHYVWLYKDKTILYMVKLTLKLSCAMNFVIYPHDTQECKLQMESLSHTTDDMIFQWDPDVPLVVGDEIELPQLALIQNQTADCTQVYSTGNFTCLEVIFVLKRRLGYYLFHTYIPTCLIVIMSWVSFWIKPEAAPARVTLGVTSILTLSTQHAKSQASLPPVSYLKAVDAFMSVCTVFVFMALMEYCLVNIILGDTPTPKPVCPKPPPPQPPTEAEQKLEKFFDIAAQKMSRSASRIQKNRMSMSAGSTTAAMVGSSSRRETRCSQQDLDPTDSPHPYLTHRNNSNSSNASDNILHIADIPPAPPRPVNKPPKLTQAQIRLMRAVWVDKFSRLMFPLTFTLLNCTYWYMFYEYL